MTTFPSTRRPTRVPTPVHRQQQQQKTKWLFVNQRLSIVCWRTSALIAAYFVGLRSQEKYFGLLHREEGRCCVSRFPLAAGNLRSYSDLRQTFFWKLSTRSLPSNGKNCTTGRSSMCETWRKLRLLVTNIDDCRRHWPIWLTLTFSCLQLVSLESGKNVSEASGTTMGRRWRLPTFWCGTKSEHRKFAIVTVAAVEAIGRHQGHETIPNRKAKRKLHNVEGNETFPIGQPVGKSRQKWREEWNGKIWIAVHSAHLQEMSLVVCVCGNAAFFLSLWTHQPGLSFFS